MQDDLTRDSAAKRLKSHQAMPAKAKKRANEPKSNHNGNFEQGGRLDDEAQD